MSEPFATPAPGSPQARAPITTRVLLVAQFDEASHAHGALQQRALERLGCTVTSLNLKATGWLERLSRRDLGARLMRALGDHDPELVLCVAPDLPDLPWRALRAASGASWVRWFDESGPGLTAVPRAVQVFDLVAVPGRTVAARFAGLAGAAIVSLPSASDPSFHRPLQTRAPFRGNVVFAGRATPRRLEYLRPLVEFGLVVWGPGWKKTALRDYCQGELLSAENYVRAYAGATVGVNIHHETEPGDGSCNRRLFEIAAIGTAQAVDDRAELADHYDPDGQLFVFRDPESLHAEVRRALAQPELRLHRAMAARRRTLGAHSYMHRLVKLLESPWGRVAP